MKLEASIDQAPELDAGEGSGRDVHLLDVLIVLSRGRRLIFLFVIGAAILAALALALIPSRYTAETVVLPPSSNSAISSALLSQAGGSGALASAAGASLGFKNPGDMYISLFESRTVEDSVIQRFGLLARYRVKRMSDARKAFEGHAKLVLGAKDGLITISVTDWDPKLAAEIANGYVEEFRKFSANLAITEASQRRIFFQQQLLEAKENLAAAEEAMKGTEEATGVLQIDSQTRALIESAAALRAQVAAKEVQLQGMRAYATEDNPEMREAKDELVALQAQLAKLAGTDQDSNSSLMALKGKIPEAGMEYIRRVRDVKFYDTISELIAKQFEMAKLDEARQGAAIQVVDVAVTPDKRSFPRRGITMAGAILLGFFAGCGWCIFMEGVRRLKNDSVERERLDALRATFR
jgi:tyrosine-protein kinase Etk/Wzc